MHRAARVSVQKLHFTKQCNIRHILELIKGYNVDVLEVTCEKEVCLIPFFENLHYIACINLLVIRDFYICKEPRRKHFRVDIAPFSDYIPCYIYTMRIESAQCELPNCNSKIWLLLYAALHGVKCYEVSHEMVSFHASLFKYAEERKRISIVKPFTKEFRAFDNYQLRIFDDDAMMLFPNRGGRQLFLHEAIECPDIIDKWAPGAIQIHAANTNIMCDILQHLNIDFVHKLELYVPASFAKLVTFWDLLELYTAYGPATDELLLKSHSSAWNSRIVMRLLNSCAMRIELEYMSNTLHNYRAQNRVHDMQHSLDTLCGMARTAAWQKNAILMIRSLKRSESYRGLFDANVMKLVHAMYCDEPK